MTLTNSPTSFSHLPRELIFHISKYLPSVVSLSNFIQTNKHIYHSLSLKDLWVLSDFYYFHNDVFNFPLILPRSLPCAHKWSRVINWELLSSSFPFTDAQIRLFSSFISFNILIRDQSLSEDIIRDFMHLTSFDYIVLHQKVSCDFLDEFVDDSSPWTSICTYQKLSEDFMRRHFAFLNWSTVCRFQSLSTSFITEFRDNLHWDVLTTRPLTESIIEQNLTSITPIGWSNISEVSALSDPFIIKYKSLLYFLPILQTRLLLESTLHELCYDLNWYLICKYQKMSLNFLLSHKNLLHYSGLVSNPHIPRKHIYTVFQNYPHDLV